MTTTFSDTWLREIAARHPYAVAYQTYFHCVRTLRNSRQPHVREEECVLVILEDCVIVFEDRKGYRYGLCTLAGTMWWRQTHLSILELRANDDRFPSQNDFYPR